MTAENFAGVSHDDQDFKRARALHAWKVDMLVASQHIETAERHLESARSSVGVSTSHAAAREAILSCGAAIAATYSLCTDRDREGSLALTFLDYGLGWGDEKRMAVEQLLKTSTGTAPANSQKICELAEATLRETRDWFQTTAREAHEH